MRMEELLGLVAFGYFQTHEDVQKTFGEFSRRQVRATTGAGLAEENSSYLPVLFQPYFFLLPHPAGQPPLVTLAADERRGTARPRRRVPHLQGRNVPRSSRSRRLPLDSLWTRLPLALSPPLAVPQRRLPLLQLKLAHPAPQGKERGRRTRRGNRRCRKLTGSFFCITLLVIETNSSDDYKYFEAESFVMMTGDSNSSY